MVLVNTKNMLKKAQKKGYAVGHFNTSNLEITKAILDAAAEMNAPVIVAASTKALRYAGIKELSAIVRLKAKKVKIPVALHLDHSPDFAHCRKCIQSKWTSVMIDGSYLPLKQNMILTKKVVKYARKRRVNVEAELGKLGGIEGWVRVKEKDAMFTDPDEAKQFVKETKCDSLAVAIGTSHGAYKFKGQSKLNIRRLREIRKKVSAPLVLHGASSVPKKLVKRAEKYGARLGHAKGVSDSELRKAVKNGICKVNTDTDIRITFDAALREELKKNPKIFDTRTILGFAIEETKKTVKQKIKLLGSEGMA